MAWAGRLAQPYETHWRGSAFGCGLSMSDAEAAEAEASTRHARQVRRSLSSRERLDQRRQERKARAAERHAKELEQAESDSPRAGYWMRTAMEHQNVESALKEIFGLDINPLIAVDLDMSSPVVQAQACGSLSTARPRKNTPKSCICLHLPFLQSP